MPRRPHPPPGVLGAAAALPARGDGRREQQLLRRPRIDLVGCGSTRDVSSSAATGGRGWPPATPPSGHAGNGRRRGPEQALPCARRGRRLAGGRGSTPWSFERNCREFLGDLLARRAAADSASGTSSSGRRHHHGLTDSMRKISGGAMALVQSCSSGRPLKGAATEVGCSAYVHQQSGVWDQQQQWESPARGFTGPVGGNGRVRLKK